MAHLEERTWEGGFAVPTRHDRRPCRYLVYLPDLLAGRSFTLDGDVAADVADAEADLVRLNTAATALGSLSYGTKLPHIGGKTKYLGTYLGWRNKPCIM